MKVLVTGNCGFIGSNLTESLVNQGYEVCGLDNLSIGSDIQNYPIPNQYIGNVRNRDLVRHILNSEKPDAIIHAAAESHVDRSIESPIKFIEENVLGTANLIEQVRDCIPNARFVYIGTDEHFGELKTTKDAFHEELPYAPRSPYSASKASADHVVMGYLHTYGLDVVRTACSNNYGPKQFTEKLIPKVIYNALQKKEIPIYGNGSNMRDWIHVKDHCEGIIKTMIDGRSGELYLFGSNTPISNNEIVDQILNILDDVYPLDNESYKILIKYVEDRWGHDFIYNVDYSKSASELGWFPRSSLEDGIKETVNYYITKFIK